MSLDIFWITERHLPDRGGMAVSSARLVNSLRDRGHRVRLLHLSRPVAGEQAGSFSLSEINGSLLASGWEKELERLFFLKRDEMLKGLLVGFGGGLPGYLASLWGCWLNRPSVALFRGNDLDRLIHDQTRGWMVHQTLRQASLAGAVASEICTRISGLRNGPVLHTPIGIIPEEWSRFPADYEAATGLRHRYSPDGRPLVGIFGQLKSKKGLDTAFEIFNSLGFGQKARLLTVGDIPPELSSIRDSSAEYWSHEMFCQRDELLQKYLACDVVFIPSLYDGMPNVLLEAMLCECLVVGSTAGGIPDLISDGENGLLFRSGDIIGAARALEKALGLTVGERTLMIKAARRTVLDRFTAAQEADTLEAALVRLAGGPQ